MPDSRAEKLGCGCALAAVATMLAGVAGLWLAVAVGREVAEIPRAFNESARRGEVRSPRAFTAAPGSLLRGGRDGDSIAVISAVLVYDDPAAGRSYYVLARPSSQLPSGGAREMEAVIGSVPDSGVVLRPVLMPAGTVAGRHIGHLGFKGGPTVHRLILSPSSPAVQGDTKPSAARRVAHAHGGADTLRIRAALHQAMAQSAPALGKAIREQPPSAIRVRREPSAALPGVVYHWGVLVPDRGQRHAVDALVAEAGDSLVVLRAPGDFNALLALAQRAGGAAA